MGSGVKAAAAATAMEREPSDFEDDDEIAIPLERWLDLTEACATKGRDEQLLLLASQNIESDEWDAATAHWMGELARELAEGKTARAIEFGARVARAKAAAASAPPPIEPVPSPPQEVPEPPPPEAVPPQKIAVPSYLLPATAIASAPSIATPANDSMDGDGALDPTDEVGVLSAQPVLPFRPQRSRAGTVVLEPMRAPAASQDAYEETLAVCTAGGMTAVTTMLSKDLPEGSADRWTVEHYASLCAELSARGGDPERICARYGITSPGDRRRIERAWTERMAQDPALRRQFDELCAAYRAYLSRKA